MEKHSFKYAITIGFGYFIGTVLASLLYIGTIWYGVLSGVVGFFIILIVSILIRRRKNSNSNRTL